MEFGNWKLQNRKKAEEVKEDDNDDIAVAETVEVQIIRTSRRRRKCLKINEKITNIWLNKKTKAIKVQIVKPWERLEKQCKVKN